MAYQKKYATAAERSAALSRAAKSRKNIHNCGRKPKPGGSSAIASTSISVREDDRNALAKLANAKGTTMVDYIHMLVDKLKASHKELF